MEFDLTPNRADALSMVGTAYEVAALYQTEMTKPQTSSQESDKSASDELSVTVQNEDKVPLSSLTKAISLQNGSCSESK